jgi:hypothetical protein
VEKGSVKAYGAATLIRKTMVSGDAHVFGYAIVSGEVIVTDQVIKSTATLLVIDKAIIQSFARVFGSSEVRGRLVSAGGLTSFGLLVCSDHNFGESWYRVSFNVFAVDGWIPFDSESLSCYEGEGWEKAYVCRGRRLEAERSSQETLNAPRG